MKAVYSVAVFFSVALCAWLFMYEKAAEPGPRSIFHREIERCDLCHVPWRGVSEQMCLQCHEFGDSSLSRPELRFHEAEKYCLGCHTEHKGLRRTISRIDHTLFSGELQCTQCHTDIHSGLFGSSCRKCHGIKTWNIAGFRHPPEEKKNCSRCHKAPHSHLDSGFWEKIEQTHGKESRDIPRDECWRCHTSRDWRHLIMPHRFSMQDDNL